MSRLSFRLFVFFVAAALPLVAAPPPKLPVEDFFRPPACAQGQLSPDGTKVAFAAADDWEKKLAVQDLKTGKVVRMAFDRLLELADFYWKGNDDLIVLLQKDGYWTGEIFIAAADGSGTRALAAPATEYFGILDLLPNDPKHILVTNQRLSSSISDMRGPSVHTLNVRSGTSMTVQTALENVHEWLVDQEGVVRLGRRSDPDGVTWLHRREKGAPLTPLWKTKLEGDATFTPLAFDHDGRTLYVASNRNRDSEALWAFDVEKQEFVREIFARPGADVGDVLLSRRHRRPMAVEFVADRRHLKALDPEFASLQAGIQEALPGFSISYRSFDQDWHRALILAGNDRDPGGYYVLDMDKGVLNGLRLRTPWLKTNQLAEMRPIEFKARDGLLIHGYLSLPAGREPRNLPLILHPHGGPQGRDIWGFDEEVQFLCNRGYAVLQVNFRGSTGYGKKFEEAGFGEWGGKMQDDLTDAVKWSIEQGYADPKRVAIYGASYGGYATMIGLCLTPELYRCGVNYVGVTDPKLLQKAYRNADENTKAQVRRLLGGSVDADVIKAPSPVALADRIQAPVLMYYGIYDNRVLIEQGDAMAAALSRAHKTYEYKTKTKEGHGFLSKEAKLEFYHALDEFLAKNMGEPGHP
ncbi:MAG TPA: S9 family peptidase [Candidatus Limnocylindria bacterium]|jgi:dipeptidyl aminopeptidase/acylaminoacyl peptidase|nr:S9 family peptidase [Candidatus Limnocylindria bacterium]